jgi:hypothetical protein
MAPIAQADRNIFVIPSSAALRRKGFKLAKTALLTFTDREKLEQFEEDVALYGTDDDKRIMAKENVGFILSHALMFSKSKKTRLIEIQDEVTLMAKSVLSDPDMSLLGGVLTNITKIKRAVNAAAKENDKQDIMNRFSEIVDGDEEKMDRLRGVYLYMEQLLKPAYIPSEE